MRVLIAEDDPDLASELAKVMRAAGFATDTAENGEDAVHLGDTEPYDAAVVDVGMPRLDGFSVVQQWRAAARNFPVLILTARDTWSDKVQGFRAGADDYLTKPFVSEEVVMRVRAMIRRASGYAASIVQCGGLVFDSQMGGFEFEGEPLRLTGFEWRVLSTLMLRKELVVSRSELIERVYEFNSDANSNSIEVIIGRLRRKIGACMIETVRGHGYRLTCSRE
ncbi:response regulator transcription factor [Novosphingobium flavum]|uniref:Response regulator transcription factor n=1 Tax=Novosphingobium flavum TaxID=1778672 RepID=A0A7X1FSS3_9SPHN|nr:response regulator transcription factor [Novosphingobium flavum]MBC2666319.1 response regulator transcription factor [Novosphingobium flavum]